MGFNDRLSRVLVLETEEIGPRLTDEAKNYLIAVLKKRGYNQDFINYHLDYAKEGKRIYKLKDGTQINAQELYELHLRRSADDHQKRINDVISVVRDVYLDRIRAIERIIGDEIKLKIDNTDSENKDQLNRDAQIVSRDFAQAIDNGIKKYEPKLSTNPRPGQRAYLTQN